MNYIHLSIYNSIYLFIIMCVCNVYEVCDHTPYASAYTIWIAARIINGLISIT